MPPIATAIATEDAPTTPACSKSGAKARPVAGPPVSVTEPASTPKSGCRPNPIAISMPTTFCMTANTVAARKKRSTCGPPILRSDRLAPKPIVVKNAIMSGLCSVVSNVTSVTPWPRAISTATATREPAEHGRRQVVAAEDRDETPEPMPEEERDAREGERLYEI